MVPNFDPEREPPFWIFHYSEFAVSAHPIILDPQHKGVGFDPPGFTRRSRQGFHKGTIHSTYNEKLGVTNVEHQCTLVRSKFYF